MTAQPAPAPAAPRLIRLAWGSVGIAALVLGLKWLAYRLTGSLALYSDALESIINVAAAVAALIALRVSARPADENHPFGHSKAEYLSAVLEGVLIVLAALAILWEAAPHLLHPAPVTLPPLGLALSVGASVVNGLWASRLLRAGQQFRSPALQADGKHLLSDVVSSAGVLAGVVLARLTGWSLLDPLLACAVALNILWSGWHLMRDSVGGLMDAGADPQTQAHIRELLAQHAQGALEAHDLLTRTAGRITFIELHLVVPGDMTVSEAHAICDRLENVLETEIEGTRVTIHVEPQDKAKHSGVLVL
ncbi:cation diffusion facilitator family transporter [Deinococcus sp. Marseille-Q6407]|uniref:cation diffusion facilitator family transporter n=1 Tax=Deinococcus sp. Marseille-Q6407 TaxID=2969223 RepID=UPI0021C0F016|nr:cation diffusion facilitator family transporter [Deinococcus sp. Marseille-Q6407]